MNAEISPESRYWLAPHVYLRCLDNYAVLLDVRRNKYLGISEADSGLLSGCVVGWPKSATASSSVPKAERDCAAVVNDLLSCEMLTQDSQCGKPAAPVDAVRPRSVLIDGYVDVEYSITPRDIVRFAWALITAKLLLRGHTLGRVVRRMAQSPVARGGLRSGAKLDSPVDGSCEVENLRKLVAMFYRIRPLLFTARGHCLFDSYLLQKYLRRYGVQTQWVFGVATQPFAAHCWLQWNDYLLNDTLEGVRTFNPIMVL